MTTYKRLNTYELKPGMVVLEFGMRVLIDGEPYECHQSPSDIREGVHKGIGFRNCTILNNDDEFTYKLVPLSWRRELLSNGYYGERTDCWTIQGNDLAHWIVEV